MVFRTKKVVAKITPIPDFIPRVIEVNPLVTSYQPTKSPRDAPFEEYYLAWYEITQRIQYIPGLGNLGSGTITFKGCFHDLPWGLQTHIYVGSPVNIDLRNTYRIAGNQPGVEPPEPREMGLAALGAPRDGLYLREDIEIRCSFAMASFVQAQLKKATTEMVNRIIKKAELLDAGVLSAIIHDGKLRTVNPNDRSHARAAEDSSPLPSPGSPYQKLRPASVRLSRQNSGQITATPWSYDRGQIHHRHSDPSYPMELPGDFSPIPSVLQPTQTFLSGDSFTLSPDPNSGWHWSQSPSLQRSQPAQVPPEQLGQQYYRSWRTDRLPPLPETRDEHESGPLYVEHPNHDPYNAK
ncbi:hypothetical protein PG988_006570 [Apiospora saccharicola]